jgi:alpha-glucoside transport system substrate-binding protein
MKSQRRRRINLTAIAVLPFLVAVSLSGCASQQQAAGAGGGIKLNPQFLKAAKTEATRIVNGKKLGGSISVIGDNTGSEGALIEAFYKPFEEATGVTINYTGSSDSASLINTRVSSGNAPEIATMQPGQLAEHARKDHLLDLSYMASALGKDFTKGTLAIGQVDGKQYGVFQGFNPAMVWYNPKVYSGPKSPTSWQSLVDWTDQNAKAGKATWCNSQAAGASSGFPGMEFIESLFLKENGAAATDAWGRGEIKWTDPRVKSAFQDFGAVVGADAKVAGGVKGSISQDVGTGSNGLVSNPAKCEAVLWNAWTDGLIKDSTSNVKPGTNLDFFKVPALNQKYATDEMEASSLTFAFKDTPATRAFMQYIASSQAQTLLASANHWPVSNTKVPTSAYTDPLMKKIATTYFTDSTKFAAGPEGLGTTGVITQFQKAVVAYLQNPSQLDSILENVQTTVGK